MKFRGKENVCAVIGCLLRLFLRFEEFGVRAKADQGNSANDIADERGTNVRADGDPKSDRAGCDQIEYFSAAGDDVWQISQADDVSEKNDDPYPGGFRKRQQPNHQGDQPAGDNSSNNEIAEPSVD